MTSARSCEEGSSEEQSVLGERQPSEGAAGKAGKRSGGGRTAGVMYLTDDPNMVKKERAVRGELDSRLEAGRGSRARSMNSGGRWAIWRRSSPSEVSSLGARHGRVYARVTRFTRGKPACSSSAAAADTTTTTPFPPRLPLPYPFTFQSSAQHEQGLLPRAQEGPSFALRFSGLQGAGCAGERTRVRRQLPLVRGPARALLVARLLPLAPR